MGRHHIPDDHPENTMRTRRFWIEAAERAVKTAAQAVLLLYGADVLTTNAFQLDWVSGAGFAAGGFVLSVVTSIASAPVGAGDSPSVV